MRRRIIVVRFSGVTLSLLLWLGLLTQSLATSQIIAWGDIAEDAVPLGLTNTVAIAAAHYHNLSLEADGTFLAWPASFLDPASNVPFSPGFGLPNVVRMAGGVGHDIALRDDGSIAVWGDNSAGQAIVPAGLFNVTAVAAGGYHSLALKLDGSVAAWGANWYGECNIPAQVTNVVALAAGFYHSLALRMDGTVIAWGDDSFGQTEVPIGLTNAVAIAASGDHSLALTASGSVMAWGDDSYGQTEVPSDLTDVTAIAAGDNHSLAMRADGSVIAWGHPLDPATQVPPGLTNVVAIAAGGSHSVALSVDDGIIPVPPLANETALGGSTVILSAGVPNTEGLTAQWQVNGTNLVGATNAMLRLGNVQINQSGTYSVTVSNAVGLGASSTTALTVVPFLIISAPQRQTAFVETTASLSVTVLSEVPVTYQWLFNDTNLPGANGSTLTLSDANVDQTGYYSVMISNAYGMVTTSDVYLTVSDVVEWGEEFFSGLGVGDVAAMDMNRGGDLFFARWDGTVAIRISDYRYQDLGRVVLDNVATISGGLNHALALRKDGTLVVWGSNQFGQTNVPSGLTNVVAITAGDYHSLALKADSSVVAWGDDSEHQIEVPTGLTNVVAITAEGDASLAVTSDGRVIAWGTDISGGDALKVPAWLSNVVAVSGGDSQTLALCSDGTLAAWGDNSYGETNVPANLTNVIAISARDSQNFALTPKGTVVAWGINSASLNYQTPHLSNVVAIAGNLALFGMGPPHLATPLPSRAVATGETTSFRVTPTGALPFSYQWQFNGKNLAGATNPVLTLNSVQPEEAGLYSVIVSNARGTVTSTTARLSVAPLLINAVTTQPFKPPLYEGGTATLSVLAQGTNLAYQWLINGVPITDATNAILTLTNIQLYQAGAYSAVVSNPSGELTSEPVALALLPLGISGTLPSQTNFCGGTSSFTVYAQGSPPFSYQWLFNGTAIPGATNSTLTLNNVQFSQAGLYSAIVANAYGLTNSTAASLTVEPALFYSQPRGQTNFPGFGVLWAFPTGMGPFSYQWLLNGTILSGETNSNLSGLEVSGRYSLAVSNVYGWAISQEANVVILNLAEWQSDSSGPPTYLSIPAELTSIASSSAGWSMAGTTDGRVVAVPNSSISPPPIPGDLTNTISLAAGWAHALALRGDGTVSAWGDNRLGQTDVPAGLRDVVAIAAGELHNLALRSDGSVIAWGDNTFGQTNVPAGLTNVVGLAAGTNHSLAVTREGLVVGWGADSLGRPINVPPGLSNIVAVASGSSSFLALRDDGTITVWPTNSSDTPLTVPYITNVVALAVNGGHDLELIAEGYVVSWSDPTNVPPAFDSEFGVPVRAVAAGGVNLALLDGHPPLFQAPLFNPLYNTKTFSISFSTQNGRVYALEYKDSLDDPQWKGLPLIAGSGHVQTLTDPNATGRQRFYRMRQW